MKSYYRVRRATVNGLPHILSFIAQKALESEGRAADLTKLEIGIATALRDEPIAISWVLVDHAKLDFHWGTVICLGSWGIATLPFESARNSPYLQTTSAFS